MTAATYQAPAFVPPFVRALELHEVFTETMREYGYDGGDLDYWWEHGTDLEKLSRLKTYVCNTGWRQSADRTITPMGSFHCPRRASIRMAARVALGECDPPRFRIMSREWREVMSSGEREQFLSYRGL